MSKIDYNYINNLCGFVDFGFSIKVKDNSIIYNKLNKINYEEMTKIIKKQYQSFNISEVGNSVCVNIGESVTKLGNKNIATPSGMHNFMEILSDGSFKCRVLIFDNLDIEQKTIGNISSIYLIMSIFSDIYRFVIGERFSKNFIEALKYEKLTVLKQFTPRIILRETDRFNNQIKKFYDNYFRKYGNHLVLSDNRIPQNGFLRIDKNAFEKFKIKYNPENLFLELFNSSYINLGYTQYILLKKMQN